MSDWLAGLRAKFLARSAVQSGAISAPASIVAVVTEGKAPERSGAPGPAPGSASPARFDRFILGPRSDAFFFGPGATLLVGGVLLLLPLLGAGGVATKLTAALSL